MQRLETIGMPKAQQSDLCALSLLAMAGLKPKDEWKNASNEWIRIHDIIAFVNENYGATYAENSRETFRKQAMHRFRTAALIEDNGKVFARTYDTSDFKDFVISGAESFDDLTKAPNLVDEIIPQKENEK